MSKAEIRCGGANGLRVTKPGVYEDLQGNRFEKLTVEQLAAKFGPEYLITVDTKGVPRIYKKN